MIKSYVVAMQNDLIFFNIVVPKGKRGVLTYLNLELKIAQLSILLE